MKKYIIALGSLGTIVTPLVSVISCNKTKDAIEIIDNKIVKKKIVSDKVLSYLQTNNAVLLEALKTAREDSNNANELKANLVANISSGNISTGMRLGFDEKLAKFATPKVIKGIVEENLKLIAPTGSLKRKGTYGITWVKGNKVIIKNQELGYAIANKGFFGKLDTVMKLKGKITLAIDSFSKMKDEDKIIPKLKGLDLLKGKIGVALNSLKDLDFTVKDFKGIISSIKMIVHNIDADLPAIMASNHKLSSLLKLAKTPNVILNKEEFYKGVSTLINKFADLVLRNKTQIGNVIKAINLFKPGLISETKSKLISTVVESKFFENFVTNLKTIKPVKVEALGKIILSIVKNNDFKNFNIMKFITKKGNLQNVTGLFNTLGISYEDMIKAVIDNFDKIKPLIGFLKPTKDKDGKIVDKFKSVTSANIKKFIVEIKKIQGVLPGDDVNTTIDKVSTISLGKLIECINQSGILSSWSIDIGPLTNQNFWAVSQIIQAIIDKAGEKAFGKESEYYNETPILSYDFFNILSEAMNLEVSQAGIKHIKDKLPKGIVNKLENIFKYIKSPNVDFKREIFTKNIQSVFKNLMYILIKKNNSLGESEAFMNNILKNKTLLSIISAFKGKEIAKVDITPIQEVVNKIKDADLYAISPKGIKLPMAIKNLSIDKLLNLFPTLTSFQKKFISFEVKKSGDTGLKITIKVRGGTTTFKTLTGYMAGKSDEVKFVEWLTSDSFKAQWNGMSDIWFKDASGADVRADNIDGFRKLIKTFSGYKPYMNKVANATTKKDRTSGIKYFKIVVGNKTIQLSNGSVS